jgi:hypothetical protein
MLGYEPRNGQNHPRKGDFLAGRRQAGRILTNPSNGWKTGVAFGSSTGEPAGMRTARHSRQQQLKCVFLRRVGVRGWFAGTTDSAHRVLRLLGREISLRSTPNRAPAPVMESSNRTNRRERGRSNLWETTLHTQAVLKLFFPLHCFHSSTAVDRDFVGISSVVAHHDPGAASLCKFPDCRRSTLLEQRWTKVFAWNPQN